MMTTRTVGRVAGRVTGWPAVALIAAAFTVGMIGTTLPTPLYPLYQQTFGFGELLTTIVFATYAVGVVAALLVAGSWSDQIGRRTMLRAGLVLSALAAIVFIAADATVWLFPARLLSGLSAGIFTGTATAALIDLAPEGGKARAGLIAAAANMGGLGLGPLLAGILAQYAPDPLRLCYLVDVGLVVLAMLAVECVAEPVRRARRPRLRPQRLAVPTLVRPVFVRAAIAGFAGFAVLGLFTAISPAFLGKVLGDTNRTVDGAVVLALFAASTVGQAVISRIGDRRALLAGCVGLIVGMLLVGSSLPTRSLPLLVAGALVAGLGQGMGFRAGLTAVTVAAPPQRRGEITSTYFFVLYIGITIPVIGEGAAAGAFGLIGAGMAFAGGVALLAAIALALLMRRG